MRKEGFTTFDVSLGKSENEYEVRLWADKLIFGKEEMDCEYSILDIEIYHQGCLLNGLRAEIVEDRLHKEYNLMDYVHQVEFV